MMHFLPQQISYFILCASRRVKSEKCVNCSQLKMIGSTVFWGKFLFYTVFLISILSPPKNHTVYLTWIVTGTVFLVWIKGVDTLEDHSDKRKIQYIWTFMLQLLQFLETDPLNVFLITVQELTFSVDTVSHFTVIISWWKNAV